MKRFVIASVAAVFLIALILWLVPQGGTAISESERADYVQRVEALKPLAEKGRAGAQAALAKLYETAPGAEKNLKEALYWYTKAAEQGHTGAEYALGRMYEAGEGVAQNPYRASQWYRLAAAFGHRDAQFALGWLYFSGRGLAQDYPEAVTWFRKAAERGHPGAQFLMGAMYDEGWAVDRDWTEALKWYLLSAPHAAEVAAVDPRYKPAEAIQRLEAKMSRFQIAEAEKRARAWRPVP